MESAESGKQFLAKNPNYLDEVGVDPSSIQVIVLEDWVFLAIGGQTIQFESKNKDFIDLNT